MKVLYRMRNALLLISALALLGACSKHSDNDGHEHDGHAHERHAEEEETPKGPNGGRLLSNGTETLEIAIFETGVPAEYRIWLSSAGRALPPTAGAVEVQLKRLGGVVDVHRFRAQGAYLVSDAEVYEPHSFDVSIKAKINGRPMNWSYESYESRSTISLATATEAGVRVEKVGPMMIREVRRVQGTLSAIQGRSAAVVARFAGPIRSLKASVGDRVTAGQLLATVESNQSLSNYALTSPIAGTVISRHAELGAMADDSALFEIADLDSVWVDLHLFGRDAQSIRAGAPINVVRVNDGVALDTTLERILPAAAVGSQSLIGRSTIANADGLWRPGLAVRATVTVAENQAALAVSIIALQRFREQDVVFIRVGDLYEPRPVRLGRRDDVHVEVLSGVRAGDEIVTEQSFLIKADIEKAGASHDH